MNQLAGILLLTLMLAFGGITESEKATNDKQITDATVNSSQPAPPQKLKRFRMQWFQPKP